MREIIFRGKRIGSHIWVCGHYVRAVGANGITPIIVTEAYFKDNIQEVFDDYYCVQPETIGQYTGLRDANGNRIFEGDILFDGYNEEKCLIEFADGGFDIVEDNIRWHCQDCSMSDFEIIGNIHDDPELLEE